MSWRAEKFLASVPAGFAFLEVERIDALLEAMLESAREQHRDLDVRDDELLEYVARLVGDAAEPEAALLALRGPDVLFACACLQRCPRALARLDALLAGWLPVVVAETHAQLTVGEAVERVRVFLLVGSEAGAPALESYPGTDELALWIQSKVLRPAIEGGDSGDVDSLTLDEITGPTS